MVKKTLIIIKMHGMYVKIMLIKWFEHVCYHLYGHVYILT